MWMQLPKNLGLWSQNNPGAGKCHLPTLTETVYGQKSAKMYGLINLTGNFAGGVHFDGEVGLQVITMLGLTSYGEAGEELGNRSFLNKLGGILPWDGAQNVRKMEKNSSRVSQLGGGLVRELSQREQPQQHKPFSSGA